MSMKVYEYVVLKEPTKEEMDKGATTELLIPVTAVMATDDAQATMLAGRAIPDDQLQFMDRITVAVRPF